MFPEVAFIILNFHWFDGFALHMACRYLQSEAVVKKLIEINPRVLQEQDRGGRCPIHCVVHGSKAACKYMLELDPMSIHRQTHKGYTPLRLAIHANDPDLVEFMMKRCNIPVNLRDRDRRTLLHIASMCHADKVVVMLLQHPEINVNAIDNRKDTPLHLVFFLEEINPKWEQRLFIVKKLLKHPFIIIDGKNNDNKTPLDICKLKRMELEGSNEYDNDDSEYECDAKLHCVEIVKLLEEFPVQRKWHSYNYFLNIISDDK